MGVFSHTPTHNSKDINRGIYRGDIYLYIYIYRYTYRWIDGYVRDGDGQEGREGEIDGVGCGGWKGGRGVLRIFLWNWILFDWFGLMPLINFII